MKIFQARSAQQSDAENYVAWLKAASDINMVDWKTYQYPTCNTLTVDADDEPVLMNSVHLVLVQEALAPKPELPLRDSARALRELGKAIRNLAINTGVAEVWFQCADERMFAFLEKNGYERVNTPVFRLKVGGEKDPFNKTRPGESKQ